MNQVSNELRQIIALATPMLLELKDPEIAVRPRPGKWSQKEILGHLIDSACNNQQKFVRVMQNPRLEFPGYAQDHWVDLQNWAGADWQNMIELWRSYNLHIAFMIENVRPEYLNHEITIEGTGPFKLEFIMPDYVEHLKHHLKQIFPEIGLSNEFVNVYGA